MALKFALVLAVALCLVQGMAAHHGKQSEHDLIDDMIDNALNLAKNGIHDFNENVKGVLEKGEADVEKAVEGMAGALDTLVAQSDVVLKNIAQSVTDKIEKELAAAAASGKDIAKCVEGKVDQAEKVEEDAIANVHTCVNEAEKVGEDIKTANNQSVAAIETELDNTEKEVLACIPEKPEHTLAEANKIVKCLADEVKKLPAEEIKLLAKIANEVSEAEKAVNAAVGQGATCINGAVHVAQDQETAIIKEINTCIAATP